MTLYYVVSVAARGKISLRWSPGLDTFTEATRYAREKVRTGDATLAVVVKFEGGKKTPLEGGVYPESAKKVVKHWLDIFDACEKGE